jgi:hypothetical protein
MSWAPYTDWLRWIQSDKLYFVRMILLLFSSLRRHFLLYALTREDLSVEPATRRTAGHFANNLQGTSLPVLASYGYGLV